MNATASTVIMGLIPSEVGRTEASATNSPSHSQASPVSRNGPPSGVALSRQVPIWCAEYTPAWTRNQHILTRRKDRSNLGRKECGSHLRLMQPDGNADIKQEKETRRHAERLLLNETASSGWKTVCNDCDGHWRCRCQACERDRSDCSRLRRKPN